MNTLITAFSLLLLLPFLAHSMDTQLSQETIQNLIEREQKANQLFCHSLQTKGTITLDLFWKANPNCSLAQQTLLKAIRHNAQLADIEKVKIFLTFGTDPNFICADPLDKDSLETPLCKAARLGNVDIINALLEAKASVHLGNGKCCNPPLIVAARNNQCEATKLLLTHDPLRALITLEHVRSLQNSSQKLHDYTQLIKIVEDYILKSQK